MSEDAPVADAATPAADAASQDQVEAKPPRTYTQEEFDRVIGKVRSEERSKFGDYDDLKERASRYDEIAESAKTQEERLQESLANRERELEDLRRTHQETLVRSAATLVGGKLGVVDPEAVTKLLDWSQIEYDESGQPTNVDELVQALVADKSYLTAKPSNGPTFDGGARQPAPLTSEDPKEVLGHGLLQHLQGQG